MILGIDIGGTHTDAVCLDGRSILATAKAITGDDLVDSIVQVVGRLGIDYAKLKRVVLSTTLSTNAIVEKKFEPTGMIVSAGPGIDPSSYFLSDTFHLVKGAIDHRGREYVPIKKEEVLGAANDLKKRGIRGVGVVSKFSVRNAAHETSIVDLIRGDFRYLSMGHTMSGSLNFPRRLRTTYFNCAVMPVQERFVVSVQEALARLGIQAPLFFLKADGGTYASAAADRLPVETILSGPAASMMGALALNSHSSGTVIVLDVGGTTTDIGILVNGLPILEPNGVNIGGVSTLVRGLKMVSVGAGGDSCVHMGGDTLCVGPHRSGPPACLGGVSPTPMDAFTVIGGFTMGDAGKSMEALAPIVRERETDVGCLCNDIISVMVENIRSKVYEFIDEVNSHPVYTIFEMLHPEPIKPDRVILIGGPARLLKPYIEKSFGMECEVPEYSMVANALGAALARTTAQITLLADTQMKRVICPELHLDMDASPFMSMADLKATGIKALRDHAHLLGLNDEIEVCFVEEQSFSMVRGFNTVGKNMRIKIQTTPGILSQWRDQ
jgi:N-methylhydantoinase A/oxoprolinase/acetone carboxylase beta subunit